MMEITLRESCNNVPQRFKNLGMDGTKEIGPDLLHQRYSINYYNATCIFSRIASTGFLKQLERNLYQGLVSKGLAIDSIVGQDR